MSSPRAVCNIEQGKTCEKGNPNLLAQGKRMQLSRTSAKTNTGNQGEIAAYVKLSLKKLK